MINIGLFLLLCSIVPHISCLINPSSIIVSQLSRLNYPASTFIPLRLRLNEPAPNIVSVLSCRKFNVEQKENMTLLHKSIITFQENNEMEVNRTIDWYREVEWKFGMKP
jgi:hypothetical protein